MRNSLNLKNLLIKAYAVWRENDLTKADRARKIITRIAARRELIEWRKKTGGAGI